MRLSPYLHADLVVTDLIATDGRQAIGGMVDRLLLVHPKLDRELVIAKLREREDCLATGLEQGVAVPHATLDGLSETVLVVARLPAGIDMGTQDGSLVRILFMMLSPNGAFATHIRLLARLARLCSSPPFLEAMLAAADGAALYDVIVKEDQGHV